MSYLLPSEVAELACNISHKKVGLSIGQLVVLGVLAGAYVGFGANLATVVANDAAKYVGAGITQLLFGAVFSVGLMLVVIGGAELFTGNNMYLMIGTLNGSCTWGDLGRNWVVVWIANLVGSLLLVSLLVISYYGTLAPDTAALGLFKGAVGAKALLIAKGKLELSWASVFARAILCNWLVCLAIWLALASQEVAGKILAIFFPIMAFVACGFEHSVANMFFIPMGLAVAHFPAIVDLAAHSVLTTQQAALLAGGNTLPTDAVAAIAQFRASLPGLFTWQHFLLGNLLPVTLGNIVGGSLLVGTLYWYSYQRKG
ncbi:MAG: formate/nitrite transporter family protein [Methylocystaceae bacterium]